MLSIKCKKKKKVLLNSPICQLHKSANASIENSNASSESFSTIKNKLTANLLTSVLHKQSPLFDHMIQPNETVL